MKFIIRKKTNTNDITPRYVPKNFLGIWVIFVATEKFFLVLVKGKASYYVWATSHQKASLTLDSTPRYA
ncbi:MAG TPA: hypothetical protein VFG77_00895 [Nitrososphaeraceae archaeon]|nr:hypothetical protein [Nitrososphaeraceae archaeon]